MSSTGPGSKASVEAMGAMMWTLLPEVIERMQGHEFAHDIAAVFCKAIDPRSKAESIDEAVRLALGPKSPDRAASYVWHRIRTYGPAHFGAWNQPDVEVIAARLQTTSASAANADLESPASLHTRTASTQTRASTLRTSS